MDARARTLSALAQSFEDDLRETLPLCPAPARVAAVTGAADTYLAHAMRRGQRLGDVKLVGLEPQGGWLERFRLPCG